MTDHGARSWPDVAAADETLLVPLGSTEQHGPHLPFDTDTRIAVAVATGAARIVPHTIVAPAVPYGSSGEHQAFDGTLSIGTPVLASVLIELARSALSHFRRMIIVNGHGGNAEAVGHAVQTLSHEGRDVSTWWPDLRGEDPLADAHAGHTETSLLLHLCPEAVRFERAEPGNTEEIDQLVPRLMADGVRPHSPTGVLGDPSTASAERGATLLDHLVDALVNHLIS